MAAETTRQRYLDAVIAHMLTAGRTDMSLVKLADAAETSDRMLLYYFKTRDALLTEVLSTVRARRRRQLASALARVSKPPKARGDIVEVLRWIASPDDATAVRFFYEAGGQGFREEAPFDAFLAGTLRDWVDEATLTARRLGTSVESAARFGTMFAALGPALACDLLATGDTERVHATIDTAAGSLAALLET